MERYRRQIQFKGLGATGQERLLAADVAIVGLGASGSVVAQSLARAGVGRLRLIDRDIVELDNLARQVLYSEADAQSGRPKALAAAAALTAANSTIRVDAMVLELSTATIDEALGGADLIIDGSDSMALRYLINEWCVREARPWIYIGLVGGYGMTATMLPGAACLHCMFGPLPSAGSLPTCATDGVVGPIASLVAQAGATEALKLLAGADTLNPGLLAIDGWRWTFDQLPRPPRHPACPVCSQRLFPILKAPGADSEALCGRNVVQVRPLVRQTLDLKRVGARLASAGLAPKVAHGLLRCDLEAYTLTLFPDGRALVHGTEDVSVARALYGRWIGD